MSCKHPLFKIAVLLTEQAILAAEEIKFEPRVNGIPVSVSRLVEYSFTIY